MNTQTLLGQRGGQHLLAKFVDHTETYGRHVVRRFAERVEPDSVLDLGMGAGNDLTIVRDVNPAARLYGVDFRAFAPPGVESLMLDIERDRLPFADASLDLVMANQVLEHTKEVFWVFHEATRVLKVGGHLLIGVPNIASLHNRLLLLFGIQPTQHKLCSAHVRPFSKGDTLRFLEACWPGGYELVGFAGAQFYPFPRFVARPLAALWPTAAFSIFFLLHKTRAYGGEFARYPAAAELETNFFTG